MPKVYMSPVAESVPFDNDTNGFVSTNLQDAVEEVLATSESVASPGFTYGSSGNVKNSYLQNETVPSNLTGRLIYLGDPELLGVAVSVSQSGTFEVEIYEHDKTTFTLVATLAVTNDDGASEIYAIPITLTSGLELAAKINNLGSARNPVVFALIKGTLPV